METHILMIKPPLQIVDVSNGCKAYSSSIYIPAKSELTTMIQSITCSQFFLNYNFNYTNVSKFLIWHKTDFVTLTPDEIKTLKAKMLKLPTMPMEIFKKVLGNIDKKYPFSLSPKLILALLIAIGLCTVIIGILLRWPVFIYCVLGTIQKSYAYAEWKSYAYTERNRSYYISSTITYYYGM